MRYKMKSVDELSWLDVRDQAKLDIKKIVRRLENDVMDDLASQFDKALNAGRLENINLEIDDIIGLVKKHARTLEG